MHPSPATPLAFATVVLSSIGTAAGLLLLLSSLFFGPSRDLPNASFLCGLPT